MWTPSVLSYVCLHSRATAINSYLVFCRRVTLCTCAPCPGCFGKPPVLLFLFQQTRFFFLYFGTKCTCAYCPECFGRQPIVCIYLYIMYVCTYTYIHININVHVYILIYIYMYMYICTPICIYIYTYVYSHVYVPWMSRKTTCFCFVLFLSTCGG